MIVVFGGNEFPLVTCDIDRTFSNHVVSGIVSRPLSTEWITARRPASGIFPQETGHFLTEKLGISHDASTMLTVSNHLLQALHRDCDVVTNTGGSSFWKASFHWSDHPYSSRFKGNPKIMYPMRRREEVEI